MIKGLSSTGKYIAVSGGQLSGPYISPGAVGSGMVRWNSNTNEFQVNDGNSWQSFPSSYPSIGLNNQAEEILDWASQKMREDQELEKLSQDSPAVKAALENLNKAKEQLKATIILSKDYEKSTS
jgi:hypothetical protein